MADYRRHEIYSGLFVLLALVVFALFAFRVGGFDLGGLLKGEVLVCRSYFTDVKTLQPGAEVKVGGQIVGEVTGVRVVERELSEAQAARLGRLVGAEAGTYRPGMLRQQIELAFELFAPDLRVDARSASVSLSQSSLLTSHYLELDPGAWDGPSSPPLVLEITGELVIPAREGGGFEDIVERVKPLMQRANDTLRLFEENVLTNENTTRLEKILEELEATVSHLRRFSADAEQLVAGGRTDGVRQLLERSHALLERLDRSVGALEEDARGVLGRGKDTMDDAARLLESANGLIEENRVDIALATRSLRQAMWQAELALRRIRANPSVLLFGDDEPDLEARPQDESGLRYSGRARPYEQRDERDDE